MPERTEATTRNITSLTRKQIWARRLRELSSTDEPHGPDSLHMWQDQNTRAHRLLPKVSPTESPMATYRTRTSKPERILGQACRQPRTLLHISKDHQILRPDLPEPPEQPIHTLLNNKRARHAPIFLFYVPLLHIVHT